MPYPYPVLFEFGRIKIFTYGFFFFLAFLAFLFLSLKRRKYWAQDIDEEHIYNLAIISIIAGIIGARIAYILTNISEFKSFYDIIALWHGGLSFFGGLLLATIADFIYIKIKKLDFWKIADILAVPLALGISIGRVGAFLSGANPGLPTTLPWGIEFQNVKTHPTALYHAVTDFLTFTILLAVEKKEKIKEKFKEGFIFLLFLAFYGISRFAVDFFRDYGTNLSLILLSRIVPLLLTAIALILIFRRKRKR